MDRILLVEDAPEMQLMVSAALGREFQLTAAESVAMARKHLGREDFDLILLDAGLPDGDGFQLLAEIKAQPELERIHILMMTGRTSVSDKVMGFSLGADDYIAKPFDPQELKARVQARLRRSRAQAASESFRVFNLRFDLSSHLVYLSDGQEEKPVHLTPAEYKILLFLARNEGRAFSRGEIIESVWGPSVHISERTVDTHVSNLRRKARSAAFEIRPIRAVGYGLFPAEDAPQPAD